MISFIRDLVANKRLVKEFVVRDLKARYVGSSMGFFWSVVFPLINLVVYAFVFNVLLHVRFGDKAGITHVAIWMLAGIVVWSAFAETLTRATNCLVENANLIQKVVFPAGVLPVYLTISSIINMTIGLPIVLAGVLYFQHFGEDDTVVAREVQHVELASLSQGVPASEPQVREPRRAACNQCDFEMPLVCAEHGDDMRLITPRDGPVIKHEVSERDPKQLGLGFALVALPLLMLLQAIFTVGLGLFLSAFNLIIRDTFHVIGVLVMVWMFSTPIFYPPGMITDARDGQFAWILDVNPMYWLISAYRDVLLFNQWPNPQLLAMFAGASLLTLVVGATFFNSQRDRFPDLL